MSFLCFLSMGFKKPILSKYFLSLVFVFVNAFQNSPMLKYYFSFHLLFCLVMGNHSSQSSLFHVLRGQIVPMHKDLCWKKNCLK
jgi:hypothetical protein